MVSSKMIPSVHPRGFRIRLLVMTLLMALAAGAEYAMGRRPWGVAGIPGFWSGNIWSEHNSQFFLDPYTFTHIVLSELLLALWIRDNLFLNLVMLIHPIPMIRMWQLGHQMLR